MGQSCLPVMSVDLVSTRSPLFTCVLSAVIMRKG